MYIVYKNTKYPCKCRPSETMRYSELPDDFPVPVEGEIALYADDDFLLRIDNTSDYLRQAFENGVLTLTNEPEPEPAPEPELTPAELREQAYNTERIITWENEAITVTEAAQLWQYYAAEGNEKANELTVLIKEAKAIIREKYPD